jgi:hypothetical protein
MPFVPNCVHVSTSEGYDNMRALQAYKSSDRLDAALRLRLTEPNPDPAARLIIEEADPPRFRRLIGSASGSKRSAQQAMGRLFRLFWPLTIARNQTRTPPLDRIAD